MARYLKNGVRSCVAVRQERVCVISKSKHYLPALISGGKNEKIVMIALMIFRVALLALLPLASLPAMKAEELTYEKLVESVYTDHVQHFQKLFAHMKVRSFIEFGVGYGTKYFLDHCQEVTSCEILFPKQKTDWFDESKLLFAKYKNWTPILKRGSKNFKIADKIARQERINPALKNASYLKELKQICNELFAKKSYDVAFVDPGFHMRGDLVRELFNRVPIIVAHDTNASAEIYGWGRVHTPLNYEKIIFKEGSGVTFWIRKDKEDLIRALQKSTHKISDRSHLNRRYRNSLSA